VSKTLCKYDNARLKQMINERGVTLVVEELAPTSIADPELRELWAQFHAALDEIETRLDA
jgi:hypothetical protein